MSNQPGWNTDGERTYYLDEHGRPIVVRGLEFNPRIPEMDMDVLPSVEQGQYKPADSMEDSNSYPPHRVPSGAEGVSRFTDRNIPYFRPGSVHSDRGNVDHPASKPSVSGVSRSNISTDVYRDIKAQFGPEGPSNAPYTQQYVEYKIQDKAAAAAGRGYYRWKEANLPILTQEEKDDHPQLYGGDPPGLQTWHQEVARQADQAARVAETHVDLRQQYHANYIGYHQHHYLHGHQEAIDNATLHAAGLRSQEEKHNNWQSLADRKNAGRQKKEERNLPENRARKEKQARLEEENRARKRERARLESEKQARKQERALEAENRAREEQQARLESEKEARKQERALEAENQAREEQQALWEEEERARWEQEERARWEQEERARWEQEERARWEQEERARWEQEERARWEQEERAREEERSRLEHENRASARERRARRRRG